MGTVCTTGLMRYCTHNQRCVMHTCAYPEGFAARGDGGLKVVPGGHLEREVHLMPTEGDLKAAGYADYLEAVKDLGIDGSFKELWLKGRRHKVTGEPLSIAYMSVPRGSMVSAAAHMPHGVEPRGAGREGTTRLCTLFCYAKPDPARKLTRSPERRRGGFAFPPEVLEKAIAGAIPTVPAGEHSLFSYY